MLQFGQRLAPHPSFSWSITSYLGANSSRNTVRIGRQGIAMMHTAQQPRFSQGTDETSANSALGGLLSTSGGRWTLAKEGEALERTFKFKTFAKTWV